MDKANCCLTNPTHITNPVCLDIVTNHTYMMTNPSHWMNKTNCCLDMTTNFCCLDMTRRMCFTTNTACMYMKEIARRPMQSTK